MNDERKPLNLRQERFAQFVAQGIPAAHAYAQAGYSCRGKAATVQGFYLLKTPRVAARVKEIQDLAASLDTALLTIVQKRRFLAEVVRTPVGSIGPDSWLCQGFSEKVKVREKRGESGEPKLGPEAGEVVLQRRVRMVDKLQAIALDSKLAGHFSKERTEEEKTERPTVDLEAIRRIAARLRGPLVFEELEQRGNHGTHGSS